MGPSDLDFRPVVGSQSQASNSSIEILFRKFKPSINIFPIPNSGMFTIECSCNSDLAKQIKVFDLIGNLLFTNRFSGSSYSMNLSNQSKGIYYLEVIDEKNIMNQKIIIE
jgi:hypothetical protein